MQPAAAQSLLDKCIPSDSLHNMACVAAPHHKELHGRERLFCKQNKGASDHGNMGPQGAGQVLPSRACLQKDGVSSPQPGILPQVYA